MSPAEEINKQLTGHFKCSISQPQLAERLFQTPEVRGSIPVI